MCWLLPAAMVAMLAFCTTAFAADYQDRIDTTVHYQTIENFGASDAWTMRYVGNWSDANRNKVADLLFSVDKGIGLSLWRFNIGGGTNTVSISNPARSPETFEVAQGKYDWNRQAGEQWMARAAHDRGVPYLLGFVNSPPGRMMRSGLTNSDRDETSSTNLKPGFESQYATYLCDIIQHFQNEPDPKKLSFDYLSPVNEPQIDWSRGSQEGNRASNEDIKKILLAVHEELIRRKLPTKIRALESSLVPDLWAENAKASKRWNAVYGNYLHDFLGDPTMAGIMDHTLCYHDYSSFGGPAVENDHRKLGELMRDYAGDKLWMSEICILSRRRDLGMEMALDVAKLIHADLALSGASAWEWWLAISTGNYKDGLLYTDWKKPGDPESIILSKSFWAMGNYSRFIRPGMVRVELKGDHYSFDSLLGSAYIDSKTHKLVVVYVNVANEPQNVKLSFAGNLKSLGTFTSYVTSADEDLIAHTDVDPSFAMKIPARSVVSLVGQYQ